MKRKYKQLADMPQVDASGNFPKENYEDYPREMDLKGDQIVVQLRADEKDGPGADYWPLIALKGIESFKIMRDGNTTTIQFTSPQTAVYSDDWERAADYEYRGNPWLDKQVEMGFVNPPKPKPTVAQKPVRSLRK